MLPLGWVQLRSRRAGPTVRSAPNGECSIRRNVAPGRNIRRPSGVVSLRVPRRSRYITAYSILVSFLNDAGFEQYAYERDANGAARRRHTGWRWRCGCVAFHRTEGDGHLWVPCGEHEPQSEASAYVGRGAAISTRPEAGAK